MTMYDISAEYASYDIDKVLDTVDTYVESVINYIDMAESDIITEGTADKPEPDKSIFDKIITSIKTIFEKVSSTFQKSKVVVHGTIQQDKLSTIATAVKESPEVEIKIQDVWKYSSFVDDLIEERVRKFKRKETLGLFSKVIGEGRAIDVLIRNLELMTTQMREPSNRQFYTKGRAPKPTKGAVRQKKPIPTAVKVGGGIAAVAYGAKPATEILFTSAPTKAIKKIIVAVGLKGPLLSNAAFIAGGAAGLVAINRLFSNCPRRIGTEDITLKELYNRLVSLAPNKFPAIIKADLQNASMYMTRVENLKEFAVVNDSSRNSSTVDYARKIARLLGSYAKFHQALIDFYLSIVVSILNDVTGISTKKIYKPTEMVKLESAEEFDFEPFEIEEMLI